MRRDPSDKQNALYIVWVEYSVKKKANPVGMKVLLKNENEIMGNVERN